MLVLIVGGGSVGAGLAAALLAKGLEVGIVEQDPARAEGLRDHVGTAHIVHGDGDEPTVLEAAHISSADVLAAMADDDEDNLVACLLARREYGVPRTVARVNNERNAWLFGERFGVDEATRGDDVEALAEAIAQRA